MKRIFTRDEIIDGYNDRCRVVPAGGQTHTYEAKLARLMLEHMAKAARRRKPARDSKSKPIDRSMDRLDRAIANLERAIPDHPGAGPSAGQMAQAYARWYEANQARACEEAAAAYAARNPHKREAT